MELLNEAEFKQATESNRLVIIDFFASWCMPCRKMFSILEHVEKQHSDTKFYKVDIDDSVTFIFNCGSSTDLDPAQA